MIELNFLTISLFDILGVSEITAINTVILCVKEVVTHLTYYIKWVTTSWTYCKLYAITYETLCKSGQPTLSRMPFPTQKAYKRLFKCNLIWLLGQLNSLCFNPFIRCKHPAGHQQRDIV